LHFCFNFLKKAQKKREKKITNLYLLIFILFCIHSALIILVLNIAKVFNIEKVGLIILRESKLKFYLFYILNFLIFIFIFLKIIGLDGLQIVNFIFSFIILFELCIKIAESDRFKKWIGEGLEKSIRYLIMFVISLNATYFFTRITHQIIESQNL
tara:strand:+ start:69 stop:533 length:465 start_codon:yes stop_codon:yes gene_type:complete